MKWKLLQSIEDNPTNRFQKSEGCSKNLEFEVREEDVFEDPGKDI